MKDVLAHHILNTRKKDALFLPVFFRLNNASDLALFNNLIENNQHLMVHDQIHGQLEELLKCRVPYKRLDKNELETLIQKQLNGGSRDEYGVWVYYPWSNRLVHILDESEFAEIRTNRNQYKITKEESAILLKQKVGIVGLSVGQSVALTMAMERGFGEIRLADFDLLEISNLNRIRTGVHNLGVSKVVIVAREIAEIDPFMKVVCFTSGLTEQNIDEFFLKGGRLDIMIDECDGLDMKVIGRQKAKSLGIPVVMETSDRGTLDVERFDLEPDRPILHGFIDHLDVSKIKDLTNEEKIPYLLPMVGIETISARLKASALEVQQTISTWPQLASAVALGGAVVADVCRRIALKQFNDSGRYFVDLEELIGTKKAEEKSVKKETTETTEQELSTEKMLRLAEEAEVSTEDNQEDLPKEILTAIIEAASMAPSGGNSQPWKWLYNNKTLYLFHDKIRSVSLSDFNDRGSYIALGAATENLVLKTHELGYEVIVDTFLFEHNKLIAAFRFVKSTEQSEPHSFDGLSKYVTTRFTNRNTGTRIQLKPADFEMLTKSVESVSSASVQWITEEEKIDELGQLLASAERLRIMDQDMHREFINEVRWTKEEAIRTRDGIDIGTVEVSPSELAGFQMARDWRAIHHLNEWKGGQAFERLVKKGIDSASALGFITMPSYNVEDFFKAGRAIQRMWLSANQNNISLQPQSAILFLFARMMHGGTEGMNEALINELQMLRSKFENLVQTDPSKGEVFLFRAGIADKPKVKSLRRPVDEIFNYKPSHV